MRAIDAVSDALVMAAADAYDKVKTEASKYLSLISYGEFHDVILTSADLAGRATGNWRFTWPPATPITSSRWDEG